MSQAVQPQEFSKTKNIDNLVNPGIDQRVFPVSLNQGSFGFPARQKLVACRFCFVIAVPLVQI